MSYIYLVCVAILLQCTRFPVRGEFAPKGCVFASGTATCDYTKWAPPLDEDAFGPGAIYRIVIEKVDGTIPNQAFSGIDSNKTAAKVGPVLELKFDCSLDNIQLSSEVFTSNLKWIQMLTFKSCYIQDGIPGGMLAYLTDLEEFTVDGGIIGPVDSYTFLGLSKLRKVVINADFLDTEIPTGLFSNLTNLEEIDLKSSGLTTVPSNTFSGLDQLDTLDLSGNSLTTLPDGLFTSLVSLTSVDLGNNAWSCTCDLAWLSTWSLYTGVSIDVTCSTPTELASVSLGRAVVSLGCFSSLTTTAAATTTSSGTASSNQDTSVSESSTSATNNYLLYVAIGLAGVSTLLAIILAFTICWLSSKLDKLSSPRKELKEKNPRKRQPSSVSTVSGRPPSYHSSERIFINTPLPSHRDTRVHPIYNVSYKKY